MKARLKWPIGSELLQKWLIENELINELEDIAKQYVINQAEDSKGIFRICFNMQSKVTDVEYGKWIRIAVDYKNYYDTFRIKGSAELLKRLIQKR